MGKMDKIYLEASDCIVCATMIKNGISYRFLPKSNSSNFKTEMKFYIITLVNNVIFAMNILLIYPFFLLNVRHAKNSEYCIYIYPCVGYYQDLVLPSWLVK